MIQNCNNLRTVIPIHFAFVQHAGCNPPTPVWRNLKNVSLGLNGAVTKKLPKSGMKQLISLILTVEMYFWVF